MLLAPQILPPNLKSSSPKCHGKSAISAGTPLTTSPLMISLELLEIENP